MDFKSTDCDLFGKVTLKIRFVFARLVGDFECVYKEFIWNLYFVLLARDGTAP